MTLPLMPGSEPLPEIAPPPEVMQEPVTAWPTNLDGSGGALAGCACGQCNDMRLAYNRQRGNIPRREVNAQQWMQQAYNSSMENIQRQAFAVPVPPPFDWGAQEAPQSAGANARRIRGRYDFSQARHNSGLHGTVRWLDPVTGHAHGDPIEDDRQWTFRQSPDGWVSDGNYRFTPTEV